ncbi:MAG: hypothetical protein RL333_306 [Pseudomonadota bacterium]
MIREIILTTISAAGEPHLAPMGVHVLDEGRYLVMPFRPSRTLDNLVATGTAVMNYCEDVRVFAGCLTGRRDWPLSPADEVAGVRLAETLGHAELLVDRFEDDPVRAKFYCRVIHEATHQPFKGYNRAQIAVLEAAILVSRLDRLPPERIRTEIQYLSIAIEKTAGPHEQEAWDWLMDRVNQHLGGRA